MDATVFLTTAEVAEELIGSAEVADRWLHDSALVGYTVGGLAGHLARAVLTVAGYLDTRLVELVLHLDDLAVSVGRDTAEEIPTEAYATVAAVVARIAVVRAGGVETVRSLGRRERHPDAVRAF